MQLNINVFKRNQNDNKINDEIYIKKKPSKFLYTKNIHRKRV